MTERSDTAGSLSQVIINDAGSSLAASTPRGSMSVGRGGGGGLGVRAGLMSLRSTCLNGSTLLHTSAFFGQEKLVIRVLLMLAYKNKH